MVADGANLIHAAEQSLDWLSLFTNIFYISIYSNSFVILFEINLKNLCLLQFK